MARLRLKTKLVLAISSMVVALVTALSFLYISQLVRQRVDEAYDSADFVSRQIFHTARQALEIDLSNTRVDTNNPTQLREALAESLQTDPGLNALLQSIVGYSPIVYDASIVDTTGRVLMHSDDFMLGKGAPVREDFADVRNGSFWHKVSVLFGGATKVYEVRVKMDRAGEPFGEIRVGISPVFLAKSDLQPQVVRALVLSSLIIVVSFVLAAALSNFALKPLEEISRRLDLLAGTPPEPRREGDEVGAVNTKIERIGREMRDVKEVFSALKENLDQIMANLQEGLMLFTRDHRAVLVSASAEQFVGRPRGEMLGKTVDEIFPADTRLGWAVRQAFAAHWLQDEVQTENGRRVQIALDFIEERGERMGALLTMRDAESVRRIEDEIELSRRLAAIGRLTSGVAHEVKNPINAIVVHLEILRQKLQQVDPDARRHMDVIGSEIQRLDRVVQTLVDFTRPVELKLHEFDLRPLLEDVVLLAAPDAERQGVSIERELCNEALVVTADADLLKQAVLNIVLNGIQAMPEGGTLRIAGARREDEVEVAISDQGQGIPPEIRDKIFNLYFTTKTQGSGIGLAMTYRVMQLHNGSVEFDSEAGRGTTFRLRIPAAVPAAREVAARSQRI